ncbi:HIRAN domain-containing protein [Roseomonas sp. GCM10028921]
MIESFLLYSGTTVRDPMFLDAMRVGAQLNLQPYGRSRVEVRTTDGHPLGWLPSEDAQMVSDLIDKGALTRARVRGLIPTYGRSRVQIAIEIQPRGSALQ